MAMAETVAAVSSAMATTMATAVTSAMSAAAVTAAPGYRAARERHSENDERNSNQPPGHGPLLAPRR
jgi:hypothetical protein